LRPGYARSERVGGDFGTAKMNPVTLGKTMLSDILIEAEAPADSATTFRLRVDGSVVATGLTAGQARFLVGEILERIGVADGDNEVN
jgi:hypothetical protein